MRTAASTPDARRPPYVPSQDAGLRGALDRVVSRAVDARWWTAALVIAALLAAAWGVVQAAGGTRSGTPHLFYLPIILAALPFGIRGATGTAVVAAVLCGPLMPLDSVSNEPQALTGMIVRATMFLGVAALAGLCLSLRRRVDNERVAHELREMIVGPESPSLVLDAGLVPLVGEVLRSRSFHPVFQPIYSLDDGRLLAVEALTRFDTEPRRTPDLWFAAAEQAGLGAELEMAAIEAALDAARSLPPGVGLSLNASPATLAHPRLHELLVSRGSEGVILELTEHAAIRDYELLSGPLTALREAGVSIAVDDAGAGFSSLQHIVQLSPDIIKLDISLTQDVCSSPVRQALGGALIEFVHRTGAQLVVEGIEEEDDLRQWCELGADAVQGFLVGRPASLPAAPTCSLISDALTAPHPAEHRARADLAAPIDR
ncbi:EAL domain-containing protein [Actinotalea sp. K2]|uniref:EAL domain-containing protein n=1 Tax=Actinotalea sp. K2 TaxID=2939438 RepID=UPI0020172E2C|nr:EAL domain-containing protein [Actinotalea sp. K2]MCL3860687.1 EAL domain-containing protein [Actinotalea sp. K2]